MKSGSLSLWIASSIILFVSCSNKTATYFTVPFKLDHNRILVEAEMQRADGSWRKALLWVDTGAPNFFMSKSLAVDIGLADSSSEGNFEISPPRKVRIGAMEVNFDSVSASVMEQLYWIFNTMHIDGNLPATVLQKYHVVFDYPNRQMTIATPGSIQPHGEKIPVSINKETGIVQLETFFDNRRYEFALDIGASYSFTSESILKKIKEHNPDWPQMTGSAGCANMWGWWPPHEADWFIVRIPKLQLGNIKVESAAIVGLPDKVIGPYDIGTWYSQKTANPVAGFLGPNVFKAFRLEIDYTNSAIYLEKNSTFDSSDLDMVGISIRLEADGNYSVAGVVKKNGAPVTKDILTGDILLQVDDLDVKDKTMGTVVNALRGKPGDSKTLLISRNGQQLQITAEVSKFL